VLAIHHTRKAKGDSPAETVSGTNGITGAVDAYIILEPGPEPDTAKAHIDGRDWEFWTHDYLWRFQEGIGWTHEKTVTEEDSLTSVQRKWLDLVRQRGRVTPTVAADEFSVSKAAVAKMRGAGYRAPLTVVSREGGRNLPTLLARAQDVHGEAPRVADHRQRARLVVEAHEQQQRLQRQRRHRVGGHAHRAGLGGSA